MSKIEEALEIFRNEVQQFESEVADNPKFYEDLNPPLISAARTVLAHYAAAQSQSGWCYDMDKAPRGKTFIGNDGFDGLYFVRFSNSQILITTRGHTPVNPIVAWMPMPKGLPKPPSPKEQ